MSRSACFISSIDWLRVLGELAVAPVALHARMQEVLIDRSQFTGEDRVELGEDGAIASAAADRQLGRCRLHSGSIGRQDLAEATTRAPPHCVPARVQDATERTRPCRMRRPRAHCGLIRGGSGRYDDELPDRLSD